MLPASRTLGAGTAATGHYWINDRYSELECACVQVQDGDEVLFFAERATTGRTPRRPLRVTGVPATAGPGRP